MSILYPLNIESTIPAFYKDKEQGQGTFIVPFSLNRATSQEEVEQIYAVIKTIQSSSYITNNLLGEIDWTSQTVSFTFSKEEELYDKLQEGQFYKIQLYYKCKNSSSYLSTVGVIKCTSKPIIEVDIPSVSNLIINKITGKYYNEDGSEKVYTYKFELYEKDNPNPIEVSEELLHNSSTDLDRNKSFDEYKFLTRLKNDKYYNINYIITTINGLIINFTTEDFKSGEVIPSDLIRCKLIAENNYDKGSINIKLKPIQIGYNELGFKNFYIIGSFILYRSEKEDNYTQWKPIYYFDNYFSLNNDILYIDNTVEHGKEYKYGIQQYNQNGLYSSYLESNKIIPDFEDMFLSDTNFSLNIKFNPKVSSFKNIILESKMDTIGSKYPYFFRNGKVNYKEFPISGLISYIMNEIDFNQVDYNLVGKNISKEKNFKLNILEWLTNGEPKLFRSSTEGNYIVRLLNTSLSPNDTLGRMLHTFSSTAYEIADNTYENYLKYNILKLDKKVYTNILTFNANLEDYPADAELVPAGVDSIDTSSLVISDAMPGTAVYINGEFINYINSSGYWTSAINDIKSIKLSYSPTGNIQFNYQMENIQIENSFNNIVGESEPTYDTISEIINTDNLIKSIKNEFFVKNNKDYSKDSPYINYYISQLVSVTLQPICNFYFGYYGIDKRFYIQNNENQWVIANIAQGDIIKDIKTNIYYKFLGDSNDIDEELGHDYHLFEIMDNTVFSYRVNGKTIRLINQSITETPIEDDLEFGYGLKAINSQAKIIKVEYKQGG